MFWSMLVRKLRRGISRKATPALLHAARNGKPETIAALLAAGANVSATEEKNGYGPLHIALQEKNSNFDAITPLVEGGADANARSSFGYTPLHSAAGNNDPDTVKAVEALLKAGANANARTESGGTPLHQMPNADIVSSLVRAGANINAINSRGKTPLLSYVRTFFSTDDTAKIEGLQSPIIFWSGSQTQRTRMATLYYTGLLILCLAVVHKPKGRNFFLRYCPTY